RRANYVSNILAVHAAQDIMQVLPKACENGQDLEAREIMANASMTAGMAFTNVSLGIVHSMAHTLGSYFHIAHGLADAVILPYIIEYNSSEPYAKKIYDEFAASIGETDLGQAVRKLNQRVGIPACVQELIPDEAKYTEFLDNMAVMAKEDGCTKTNPIIPDEEQFKELFMKVYRG
ncbi:MAG: iron-containing alcohol dehydrogenase, partial [Clostridiales bacterium]|nr:iron-containing alcohol dehydrogenase [Clostridiales bacterium]